MWALSPWAVAAAAVFLGAALRLWMLTTPATQIDADQSATGIMVENMLHARGAYVFFAGQTYNGAIEQYIQVAMYRLLPLTRDSFTLRVPEVALSAVATWLVYVVGRRVLRSDGRAGVAALLFAVAPYWSVWKSVHSDGAYPILVVFGLTAIYCSLRMVDDQGVSRRWPALLGLATGLIIWNGETGFELVLPAGWLAAPILLRHARALALAVITTIAGAMPSLLWSLKHHLFAPLTGPNVFHSTITQRLHYFFGPVFREFIGVAGASGVPGWPKLLQLLAEVLLIAGFIYGCIRNRRSLWAMLTLRSRPAEPVAALLLSVPIVAALYIGSPDSWDYTDPHYLYVLTPVLVWLLAASLPELLTTARIVVAGLGCCIVVATSFTMLADRADHLPGTSDAILRSAIHYLESHHETAVYADYWTALPLDYLSGGRIIAAPMAEGRWKFPVDAREVYATSNVVYVASLRNDSGLAVIHPASLSAKLKAHHVRYSTVAIGNVTIYQDLRPQVRPWQVGVGLPLPTG